MDRDNREQWTQDERMAALRFERRLGVAAFFGGGALAYWGVGVVSYAGIGLLSVGCYVALPSARPWLKKILDLVPKFGKAKQLPEKSSDSEAL